MKRRLQGEHYSTAGAQIMPFRSACALSDGAGKNMKRKRCRRLKGARTGRLQEGDLGGTVWCSTKEETIGLYEVGVRSSGCAKIGEE